MAYANPYYFQKPPPQMVGQVGSQGFQIPQAQGPDFSQLGTQGQAIDVDPNNGNNQQRAGIGAGGIANAAVGAVGLATDAIDMANQRLDLNADIAPIQSDPSSAPVYTGGQLMAQASGAKAKGASGGEILKGTASGAALGTSILPGWGTVIGAAVGAGASLIGGGVRKKRQRREKNRAMGRANLAGQQYNSADVNFRNKTAQQEDYNQKMSANNRMYNLYRNQY